MKDDVSTYITYAYDVFIREDKFAIDNLDFKTRDKLCKVIATELIYENAEKLAKNKITGCAQMFKNKSFDKLEKMF